MQTTTTEPTETLTINFVRTIDRDETPWRYKSSPGELAGPYTGTLNEIVAELERDAGVACDEVWVIGDVLWCAPA